MLDAAGRSGAENMAIDRDLLDAVERDGESTAYLRLYRWDPPCLSFGRNEPALARYDRALIERLGLNVVRRPTGGRAVWHEHEVTYAVAAPVAAFGSLRDSYLTIHARLALALRGLGAAADLARRPAYTAALHAGACFAQPVGGEVVVAGRKVIGSAQVRQGNAFLQHGSILLDGSQDAVLRVSRAPGAPVLATTLRSVLGRHVSFDEVAGAILAHWYGGALAEAGDPPVRRSAPVDPTWTWRR